MRSRASYKLRFLLAPLALAMAGAASASAATTLVAQHSGKCLDVMGGPGATQDGAPLEQWPCTGQPNQSWTLNDAGGGQYELVASHSQKCAEVVNGGTGNGALVRQATCTREPKQLWRLRSKPSAANLFELVNVPSHRCLDVTGGPQGTQDGNLIELWNCNGTTNQAWTMTEVPATRPTQVVARHSGKCLDVTGGPGATQPGAPIEQWRCTGARNQDWTIRDAGLGRVQLVARHSNLCLDALGVADGAGLQQTTCGTADSQLWRVVGVTGIPGEYQLVNHASNTCAGIVAGGTTLADGGVAELRACVAANQSQRWIVRAYAAGTRDVLRQPFASDSIWNTPIGAGAVYVPSRISPNPGQHLGFPNNTPDISWADMPHLDHEHIVLHPQAPITPVEYTSVGIGNGNKCNPTDDQPASSPLPYALPIPANFVVPSNNGNGSTTILMSDGRTLKQMQPFARCTAGGVATTKHTQFADGDLYKDGRIGSHGGSRLSALGGTLRVGELDPGAHAPRHAIKINVYSQEVFHDCGPDVGITCSRWPASVADGAAPTQYGIAPGIDPPLGMKMGALVAIPPSVDITALGLRTDPGRQLAWTLQNYGAYIVDSTGGPAFGLNVEKGPGLDAADPLDDSTQAWFDREYADYVGQPGDPVGLKLHSRVRTASDWRRDIQTIVSNLHLVDNNSENAVGGGGLPRQPFPPPLQ
jgi:hypothetical protein